MPLLAFSLMTRRINDSCYHTSTETLLALLQLLKQAEVAGDFGAHCRETVVWRTVIVWRVGSGMYETPLSKRGRLVNRASQRVAVKHGTGRRRLVQDSDTGEAVKGLD
jgi:hypothetical protein